MGEMSATGAQPLDYVADTELEAVWYAANQFYGASQKNRVEYGGNVYVRPDGKYVLTVGKSKLEYHVRVEDQAFQGLVLTAKWHTHLPAKSELAEALDDFLGIGQYNFSTDDRNLAEEKSTKIPGFSLYLVTDTVIKRYRPGSAKPEKSWTKEPPAHLEKLRRSRH